jgi:hypothetical protein
MWQMKSPTYSVRIGESLLIAEDVSYSTLLMLIMEFTVRAAIARSIGDEVWEHDELRRRGLAALQIFRAGRAIWNDGEAFASASVEARREHIARRFKETNELDVALYSELDGSLRECWRQAGYSVTDLTCDMKKLFAELERDAADLIGGARESMVADIIRGLALSVEEPSQRKLPLSSS